MTCTFCRRGRGNLLLKINTPNTGGARNALTAIAIGVEAIVRRAVVINRADAVRALIGRGDLGQMIVAVLRKRAVDLRNVEDGTVGTVDRNAIATATVIGNRRHRCRKLTAPLFPTTKGWNRWRGKSR